MAQDINARLNRLKIRRRGMDRLGRLNETARAEILNDSVTDERWQKRANNQPNTRYVLGSMQEVGTEYTRISVETAERVGKQLKNGLMSAGYSVEFRLQGSVPLNVHIRGVSDVDLLNLEAGYHTYDRGGLRDLIGSYTSPDARNSVSVLWPLRKKSEEILISKFPAATVDTSGGKAIAISGGSLARPVDVVPSHWHDTFNYQRSGDERDRGIVLLDKKIPETIQNLSFLHIDRVNKQDTACNGGLKKAIRLCKNVKNDAVEEGKTIKFPSFDIAATMYHADRLALQAGHIYELAILAETQRFLDELYHDPVKAKSLYVPDGSKKIFDSNEKYDGLRTLSCEMDKLLKEVAKEQGTQLTGQDVLISHGRERLRKAYIL
ncbi:hypothetical protein ASF60_22880 [Methylobacterium sp. Leaf113]|uniref:hypothetical protein n=1 Tax=Methylobacterium sp. Leaf113 TaxID=1736259 RepID=UPI0006F485B2|nr:hypothetical protein [Methylobacterium sp. Leaf113]KQP77436.1 hypothetical protein ASF60_22880 [Methylobacterium sp. Leaf113]